MQRGYHDEGDRDGIGVRGVNWIPERGPVPSGRARVPILEREAPALTVAERPERTALERSAAYRAYQQRLEDGLRYLASSTLRAAA